ncbi:MAG: addiction module antidote protein [Armatimonadota bacterium]
MRLRKFDDHLHEKLRDPEYAVAYLEAAMDDGIEEFLYALREVACAQEGGLQQVAEQANLGRESMYKSLSKRGNPRIKTLDSILDAVGLRISVSKDRKRDKEIHLTQ